MPRLSLTLGLLAGLAGLAHAQTSPGRESIPTRTALARLGLERQWSTVVPFGNVDERIVHANLERDMLFVQTNRGLVHALDATTGRRFWSERLVEGPTHSEDITANTDQVFVALHDTLFCLDRPTGRELWSVRLEAMPQTGVVADEEVAAIGLRSGKLVAYNTRDHTKDDPPGRSAGTFAWAWQAREMIHSAPIVTSKVVAFASEDHRVYAASRGDAAGPPQLLYRYLTQGPISAALAPLGTRTLVVACEDFNLYAIDLFNGATRWIIPTGAPISARPQTVGTEVFALNDEGTLFVVDGRSGGVEAETQTSSRWLRAISPTRVYLGTPDHDLEIVDRKSGKLIATARDTAQRAGLTIRQLSVPVMNTQDDRLVLVSPDGLIYSIREIDRVQPTPLRDPDAVDFGHVPRDGFRSDEDMALRPPAPQVPATDAGAEDASTPEPDDSNDGFGDADSRN